MTFAEIRSVLINSLGAGIVAGEISEGAQPVLIITNENLLAVCDFLFTNENTYFDFLSCLTGIDNGPEAGTMEVVYNLYSIPYDHKLVLKVVLQRNKEGEAIPEIPSVTPIWRSADWHERETYDLLGINFTDHPDLRRMFMPADWEGHPLRKDYQLQERYHGIKTGF